jgi:hypothetical protein
VYSESKRTCAKLANFHGGASSSFRKKEDVGPSIEVLPLAGPTSAAVAIK